MDLHKKTLIAAVMTDLVPHLATAQHARLAKLQVVQAKRLAQQPRLFLHQRGLGPHHFKTLIVRGFHTNMLHPFIADCAAKAGYRLGPQLPLTVEEERTLCLFLIHHYSERVAAAPRRQLPFFDAAIRDNCARLCYRKL